MNEAFCIRWQPVALGVFRIMTGLLFICHGGQKLFGFPPSEQPQPPLASQAGIGGILEFFGGLLIVLGLFTRPTAFILCGTMAVAYFQFHSPGGFFPVVNKGELAVLYCFTFLYFVFSGAGALSLDSLLRKRKEA